MEYRVFQTIIDDKAIEWGVPGGADDVEVSRDAKDLWGRHGELSAPVFRRALDMITSSGWPDAATIDRVVRGVTGVSGAAEVGMADQVRAVANGIAGRGKAMDVLGASLHRLAAAIDESGGSGDVNKNEGGADEEGDGNEEYGYEGGED